MTGAEAWGEECHQFLMNQQGRAKEINCSTCLFSHLPSPSSASHWLHKANAASPGNQRAKIDLGSPYRSASQDTEQDGKRGGVDQQTRAEDSHGGDMNRNAEWSFWESFGKGDSLFSHLSSSSFLVADKMLEEQLSYFDHGRCKPHAKNGESGR